MKAALNEAMADPAGAPSTRLLRLYRRWAEGGCGLLITGNVVVDGRHLSEPGNVVIEGPRDHERLAAWARAARSGGAGAWLQINHPGRQANPFAGRAQPLAPSPIAVPIRGARVPHPLGEREIEEIIGRFATAARVAVEAGFDGVQIHAAHGFLISQFLSPLSNRRVDRWGGDRERRMAFLLAVVAAVRDAVGPQRAVAVKLNSADFQRGGFDRAESQLVVERLAGEKIDLIEISGGTYEAPAMVEGVQRESSRRREAYFLEYAEQVRRGAGSTPLAVTGGFRSRPAMDQALGSGACDLVGIGRPLCLSPEAPRELLAGRIERVGAGRISTRGLGLLGPLLDQRTLRGALDVQWHTDQLHLIGSGRPPDPNRPWWRTIVSTARRNAGAVAHRRRRAEAGGDPDSRPVRRGPM